ncbi:MAG: pyrimidine dimer DNA glycosylase/endonuclease V [Brachybacterium sp.]|nr:pyrimidine dimer DNA glycosylase/endonuclease V [Brachybacterium sp.]
MRLWSPHPSILDRKALVACWRESLLAQKVLAGGTRGYTQHPQLVRLRAHPTPMEAIGAYLVGLQQEATARGYRFDADRITVPRPPREVRPIPVTEGQLAFELEHLRVKVTERDPDWEPHLPRPGVIPLAHELLEVHPGPVEPWERAV